MDDHSLTIATPPKEEGLTEAKSQPGPVERIGRYRIERTLGQGGFGLVYLAHDEQLNRPVAIKVPHAKLISRIDATENYLSEARMVANFDHPHIVPVFDVGSSEQFPCYIVSKYIDGTDLATRLRESRPPLSETAEMVATVAEALHYAHKRGLVHRDVKPGNILLDRSGKPFVADFGLAVQDQDLGKGPRYVGTPAYMSPEQARGEGHRVDGRSDVFSLGVVLYELMLGKRPFKADSVKELLELVNQVEVRPPRQIDDRIPKELERICLKALSKRASERYTTAKDMADDLRHWLDTKPPAADSLVRTEVIRPAGPFEPEATTVTPSTDLRSVEIVPKGLRSFDAHDAEFFLELLPGPRDRDGLPESIRFWKTRIEQTDADDTFCVGLIYGPSGCGKSSLVKAGLLPRLSHDVIAVYIEATAQETETRLLNGLRKRCAALPTNLALKETLAVLRRGQDLPEGKKVLIVLDQFEQWLHAKKEAEDTELVQALRQCDGGRVLCIVMVRDDFWMAATRFMRELEIRLLDGQNSAAIDLFTARHAEKVLSAYGRAFGSLPERSRAASPDQRRFIEQAVAGLIQEGKVICVRLALFAEMMKSKPWTPATLKEVGGAEGVGVTFLEETFSATTAPAEHRYRQKAARAVLGALLPESGANIKGNMRSQAELLAVSGYGGKPKDFDDLVRILDSELRLMTPTDPDGQEGPEESPSAPKTGEKYYQLTHDYLVRPLRKWLTRKQRETRRGRAELRLAERAALWNVKPENRHLPSIEEVLKIRFLTDRQHWSEPQRRMMAKAARVRGMRAAIAAAAVAIAVLAGLIVRNSVIENQRVARAEGIVDSLVKADVVEVPGLLKSLKEYGTLAEPLVKKKFEQAEEGSAPRLYAAVALLPSESMANYLLNRLLNVSGQQFPIVCDALLPAYKERVVALAQAELAEAAPSQASESEMELLAQRRATAAVALLRCGSPERVWPLLKHSPDPRVRSYIVNWLGPLGGGPQPIIDHWEQEPDVTIRRALILMLGEFTDAQVPVAERQPLIERLLVVFENETDPGLHAAAEWLLRKWKQADRLQAIVDKLRGQAIHATNDGAAGKRGWFVNSQGQTFVVLDAGEFVMGSPESEPDRYLNETQHRVHIGRRVAIAATHVTQRQYRAFQQTEKGIDLEHVADVAKAVRTDDSPQTGISWYEAARYCNWLSKQEGLPQCYVPNEKAEYDAGMTAKDKYLELTGYRLPTEAEWEFACRAGAVTSRYFGPSESLLPRFAWYVTNGQRRTWPVESLKPNDFGLFDMQGNAQQWCDDSNRSDLRNVSMDLGSTAPVSDSELRILRGGAFDCPAPKVRSAFRGALKPRNVFEFVGFRPVRTCR